MKHISLCSGIGGIDAAAHECGFETIQFVERDLFCQKVLSKNFPGVPIHDDLTTFNATPFNRTTWLVSAGFPCQPHSLAGKRKASGDERDLWPEVKRILGESESPWFLGENVPGLLSSESGQFFGRIAHDLAGMGYRVSWGSIRACDIGGCHRRKRVFIVAYSERLRFKRIRQSGPLRFDDQERQEGRSLEFEGEDSFTGDADRKRREELLDGFASGAEISDGGFIADADGDIESEVRGNSIKVRELQEIECESKYGSVVSRGKIIAISSDPDGNDGKGRIVGTTEPWSAHPGFTISTPDPEIGGGHEQATERPSQHKGREIEIGGSNFLERLRSPDYRAWDIEPVFRRSNDGLSEWLDRVDPSGLIRNQAAPGKEQEVEILRAVERWSHKSQLKALGNAVFPHQVLPVLAMIAEAIRGNI